MKGRRSPRFDGAGRGRVRHHADFGPAGVNRAGRAREALQFGPALEHPSDAGNALRPRYRLYGRDLGARRGIGQPEAYRRLAQTGGKEAGVHALDHVDKRVLATGGKDREHGDEHR